MKRRQDLRSIYGLLVWIIPLCAMLQSTLQMQWQIEKRQWLASFTPFVFYAGLSADAVPYQIDTIVNAIAAIEGLQLVHLDRSVPAWEGMPELAQEWEQLWEKHLPHFVYAATDQGYPAIVKAGWIAARIKEVPGVAGVEWDEERYFKLSRLAAAMERQGKVLYVFFSVWMLVISLVLYLFIPNRLVRKFAVRQGLLGAGSHISPETVLLKLIAIHAGASLMLYGCGQGLMWYWFAFPVSWEALPTYQNILIEGMITSVCLPTAVLLAGWWHPRTTAPGGEDFYFH